MNFGLLYGMGPRGLMNYARASYGIEMTAAEAEHYWQGFFETYPGLRVWHDREHRELKKHGSAETRTLAFLVERLLIVVQRRPPSVQGHLAAARPTMAPELRGATHAEGEEAPWTITVGRGRWAW